MTDSKLHPQTENLLHKQEDEIDLVELFLIIWNKKFTIISFTLLITILTALHQLYIAKEIFRSDCVILPVSSSGGGGMLSQLGGLASFVGMSAPKSENTLELILGSRTFSEKIVEQFELDKKWEKSKQESAQGVSKNLDVSVSKKSPDITVAWEDEDPKFAKEVLEYVLQLAKEMMMDHSASKKNTQVEFLEGRVADALLELNNSEDKIRAFQETNQGVEIEGQAQAMIAQLQALKAQKNEKDVELAVARKMLHPADGSIKILDMTVVEIQKMIDDIVGKAKENVAVSMDERSLMDIPKIGLEYARLLRQVKINQKIYGLLVEQLEMSKIEAQKDVESFEVIDAPIVPEKRIKPKRSLTVAIAMVCSGMLAVMGVLLANFLANIRASRLEKITDTQ